MRQSMHATRLGSIAACVADASRCGFSEKFGSSFAGGETHAAAPDALRACLGRRQSLAARPLGSLRRAGSVLSTDNGLPGTPPNGAMRPENQMALTASMSEPFLPRATGLPVATGMPPDINVRPQGT